MNGVNLAEQAKTASNNPSSGSDSADIASPPQLASVYAASGGLLGGLVIGITSTLMVMGVCGGNSRRNTVGVWDHERDSMRMGLAAE